MMKRIWIKYGPHATNYLGQSMRSKVEEWAANSEGEGVFRRKDDGTWQQQTGTGQTPTFHSPEELRRYLRRVFEIRDARIVDTMGW